MKLRRTLFLTSAGLWFAVAFALHAQGTAFTYQGRLNDGANPASGNYDLTVSLFATSSGGSQVGFIFTNLNTAVTNGLFTVTPDFGANFPGANRWLEIAVRTNGGAVFSTLTPRQPLTPTPYAITASNLSGTLPSTQLGGNYPATVIFTNPANSFAGSGAGLTNVNAATVNGLAATNFWQTAGNSNTSPANGYFLGTKDNQPLELKVNGLRALRLEPTASGVPNLIGGAAGNLATSGAGITIGGGSGNTGGGTNSTVPGGNNNSALGNYTFAAGNRAKATNQGAFVWADSQAADFASTSNNQFNIRAGGGVRIVTGQTNMTLDGVPVLVGSGVGVLAWQTIAATTLAAQMHYGYVLTNSQLVTVTLPASAGIGDVFRVSGAGKGGWKIAQNANQSILAGNFTFLSNTQLTWAASSAAPQIWYSIAASADGNKMLAAAYGNGIYTSANSGANWTATAAPAANWAAVASSADGVKLVAVVYGGPIYTSANSGGSWTPVFGNANWDCVASSTDGTRLVAGILNGAVYYSINSGATWTASATGWWQSVAASSDGMRLIGGIRNGFLYTSTDGGTNWMAVNTVAGSLNWTGVASSVAGDRLVAVSASGTIQVSPDAGNNWLITSAPSKNWTCVASSADGKMLVAAAQNGPVYTSSDYGATWTPGSSPAANWLSVASSADGGKLAAGQNNGGIYTLQPAGLRTTTPGTTGYLLGGQNSALELQYMGNNQFIPLSHEGTIFAY